MADSQQPTMHHFRHKQFGLAALLLVVAGFATCFGAIRLWGTLSRGPLLPHWAVSLIWSVSGSAFYGGFAGAICGLAVGAVVRAIRKRHATGLPVGLLFGIIAGGTVGSGVAALVVTLEAILCRPGPKGGYLVPEWAFWLGPCVVLLAAGFAASFAVPHVHIEPAQRRRVFPRVIVWTASAALLGALAFAWFGFNGYRSNEPPMRSALTGFIFGGLIALACMTIGELLLRLECRRQTHKV